MPIHCQIVFLSVLVFLPKTALWLHFTETFESYEQKIRFLMTFYIVLCRTGKIKQIEVFSACSNCKSCQLHQRDIISICISNLHLWTYISVCHIFVLDNHIISVISILWLLLDFEIFPKFNQSPFTII